MKKYFYITIILLCIFVPYLATLFCYNSNYESQNISRNLIVKKDGVVVGYIKGSAHYGFTEEELAQDKKDFEEIVPKVSKVFFEANTGHWTLLPYGMERIAQEVIEKNKKTDSVTYLEGLDSQKALISSLFYYGENLYYIPYGNLFLSNPGIASLTNIAFHVISFPGNLVYRNIINSGFAEHITSVNKKILEEIRSAFIEKKTSKASSKSIEQFRIVNRDELAYKKVMQEMGDISVDNKFLIVIGVYHLSAKQGLLSHFEADGYTIEEF